MSTLSRALAPLLALLAVTPAPAAAPVAQPSFTVIEFRRYTMKPGRRAEFGRYFETYFPEAFQQLGAIVPGHLDERGDPDRFLWLRGFVDMPARAAVNKAFYSGPVWKEHSRKMNDCIVDSDNVLLLRPLDAAHAVPLLPAVDPLREAGGAQGVVAAQIFTIERGGVDAVARLAASAFARYRAAGAREAGVLVTLDEPNNFPALPVRTDGPHLVWMGILPEDPALVRRFESLAAEAGSSLLAAGSLRGAPELILLDPTPRSRLRWLEPSS